MNKENPPTLDSVLNVLIVDSQAETRKEATSIISQCGHMATPAANAAEAIEKTYVATYDFILMDLVLSDMSGIAATKLIHALSETKPSIPIIALASTHNPEDVRKCIQSGMSNFTLKPLTKSKFLAIANTYLYKKRKIS